ncbi:membrane protein implicated in regulation of membrane protease activity [Catenulispora sp. GP43]|uniref:hypothetical protein n=1 Tax=Catenulispora sp. GP43 TaxID=3156263 RepID=UPI00351296DE
MTPDSLQSIADGIAGEVDRFETEYGMDLGVVVTVDEQAGTVTARGDGLRTWGPQQVLVGALTRARLRHDVYMQSATIVVYPSTDEPGPAVAPTPKLGRDAALAQLRRDLVDNGTAPEARHRGPADGGNIPLHQVLRPLIPGGNLTRGTIVAAPPRTGQGFAGEGAVSYLTLALVAGATAGGGYVGVVGYPNFGIAAASGLGANLSRIQMLDHPGDRWAEAVAVFADAVDLLLLHAPRRPTTSDLRRLTSRIRPSDRHRGCVLVVSSPWEEAHLTMRVRDPEWEGLGNGTGNLNGRHVTVSVTGRATRGRQRELELWLPAADGTIREYVPQEKRRRDRRPQLRIA